MTAAVTSMRVSPTIPHTERVGTVAPPGAVKRTWPATGLPLSSVEGIQVTWWEKPEMRGSDLILSARTGPDGTKYKVELPSGRLLPLASR